MWQQTVFYEQSFVAVCLDRLRIRALQFSPPGSERCETMAVELAEKALESILCSCASDRSAGNLSLALAETDMSVNRIKDTFKFLTINVACIESKGEPLSK